MGKRRAGADVWAGDAVCACRIVAVLYLLVCSVRAEPCPYSCTCSPNWAAVTCLESQDLALPLNVSQRARALTVRGANISVLTGSAFSALGTVLELQSLLLSWNSIGEIKARAFLGLSHLRVLDLSHNRLVRISPMAFHGLDELWVLRMNSTLSPQGARDLPAALSAGTLVSLQRLELAGNRLKAVPVTRFDDLNLDTLILTNNSIGSIGETNVSNFNEFKKISVYLSLNPFRCDCELQAFYHWLKNGSQCADSARLLCALPEARSGWHVEKMRREDVDCTSAELEAVSYVFLGIVLALIGLVFLMVLYLNRGGIKRWMSNIREACRDQMEVYHYRYEQDSDPRLANVAV